MNILFTLFAVFFKIGLFTFGGGYAMIPMIRETVIETYKWLSPLEFIDIIAISEMTPGVIAVNMATFLGTKVSGSPIGGISSTLGVVLPSSIIVYLITIYFRKFKDNEAIEKILMVIRIGVPGIIATAAYTMIEGAIVDVISVIILVISIYLTLSKKININPILIIIAAGIAGTVFY